MKHEYLVQTKLKGSAIQGLHTVSMSESKLQKIVGGVMMYKLNQEGQLKTVVVNGGKSYDLHAIKINKINSQSGIDK
jgi:hypothetical protein